MPEPNPAFTGMKITNRMGFVDLIKLSLRVFRTKLMRTLLTIFGMSIGIGTVLFLVSLGYGLQFLLIGRLVTSEDSLITLEALYPPETGRTISLEDLEVIKSIPETAEISPVAEFPGEIAKEGVSGLVFTDIVENNYFRLSGTKPELGFAFTEAKPGFVATSQALQLMGLPIANSSIGQNFNLKISYQSDETTEITEIVLPKPEALTGILTDENLSLKLLVPVNLLPERPPFYTKVLIKAKDINVVEKLRDDLIDKGYFISAKLDLVNQARSVLRAITITLGVFGITALFVAAIGMFNTMIVGFLERIYEVGIMKSLGATNRDIRNLFLMESSMLGFLGGLGGVILGVGVGQLSNLAISILSKRLGGEAIQLFITPLWFIGVIMGASVIIGLVAGFWPAHKATGLSPKAAFIRK